MIELGLFHERSFDKSHILTSETIQEQYAFSKSKRPDNKAVIDLYKIVNDVKTEVFADETPQNDTKSAYSIVKERKENITTTSSPARTYAREEILRSYRDELSNDEDWRAAIVRMSGKGPAVLDLLPGVMDPANRREAIAESVEDEIQGADILMVKPALAYLDVIRDVRNATSSPSSSLS